MGQKGRSGGDDPPRLILFVSISGWLAGPGRSLQTLISNLPPTIIPALAAPRIGGLVAQIEKTVTLDHYLPLIRKPGPSPSPGTRLLAVLQLLVWVVRHRRRLTCIHANGFTELHLVAPAAVLARVPVVVWLHGSQVGAVDRRLGPVWRNLLTRKRLAAVSSVSVLAAVEAGLAEADEIEIIPNPVDPRDCVPEFPAKPRHHVDRFCVGFLGGMREDKGIQFLADVIRAVKDPHVRWIVAATQSTGLTETEAALFADLERAATEKPVQIIGYVTDVREFYADCDAIFTPSLRESLPRVALEAMSNGLPLIASDIPAHRALLAGDAFGLLFPLGSPEIAAQQIDRLASDVELRERMADAGRRQAENYGPELIVERFVDLYGTRGPGLQSWRGLYTKRHGGPDPMR